MADVELLPCPFCGGEAHLERQGHVCCKTRLCRGADAFDNYGTPTEQNASAISRWNTRANLAPLQAENERLAEALRKLSADLRTLAGGETPDGDGVPVNVILWAEKRLAALAQAPAVRVTDEMVERAMEAAADACQRHIVCNEAIRSALESALGQGKANG